MGHVNGTIGEDKSCTWQTWTAEKRKENVVAVENKKTALAEANLSPKQQHEKLRSI